jgi:glycosyltransferase involved in cell wall biosynthesis
VLFFNEGNLGSHILGQSQLASALRTGLSATPGIEARFAGLSPMGRLSAAVASWPVPGLSERNLDLRTFRWHVVQSLRARRALEGELRAYDPAVLHLHTQSIAMLSWSIMRALPVVLSVDTTVLDWSRMPAWAHTRGTARETTPSRLLERKVFERAALVTAWTNWARRGVEREAPAANVIEHHPGIDLQHYAPASRSTRERARVLFVGGRFVEKGGEDLVQALHGRIGKDVELDLVTPDEKVQSRDGVRVHRLGASDPELLALYQQADVLCLPTHGDTNPWVILEAMACGTPVVSTPVGAIGELLGEGSAGVVVPLGDRRALGEAVASLLGDEARREQLGRAGRALCEQRYDARRQFALLTEQMRELRG